MPIDPNILLQIKPPAPLDPPDVVAERHLKLQQAQEQRRQVIETAQDNAAIQTAIQTHLGPDGLPDMEGALKAVYATNARAGNKLQGAITASREAQYKAHVESRKADEADADYYAKQMQGQNADVWPATYRRLSQTDPHFAQMMGPNWDDSMPAKVQAVVAAGTSTKDFAEQKQKAHESLVKGEDRKGLAALINAEPDLTPDSLGRIFQTFRKDWGGSPSEIAPYLQLKSIDEAKAMARQNELGQKEVEALAGQAEGRAITEKDAAARLAQTAANQTADNTRQDAAQKETARHNAATEATQRVRAAAAVKAANAGGLRDDPDALDYVATQYRVLGTQGIPTRIGEADKVAIIKAAAAQTRSLGQSPAVATQRQAAYKGDAKALTQMKTMSASAEAFETKANAQIPIILDLSAKVGRTASPMLNGWLLAGKKEVAGDTDTALLFNAISTFSAEYAKIRDGSTGSVAASSDSSRKATEELVKATMNPGTLSKVVALMQKEMHLTQDGYGATIEHITNRMGGTVPQETTPAKTSPAYTYDPKTGTLKKGGG